MTDEREPVDEPKREPVKDKAPQTFEVSPETEPVRRRAVFSTSAQEVGSHHVDPSGFTPRGRHPTRRTLNDVSLRLIDDLTNRPVDPLFSDALLVTRRRNPVTEWLTRVIVFLICVAVGFAGILVVRQLQSDPRKDVRKSLAAELRQQTDTADQLSEEVIDLRKQVDRESQILDRDTEDATNTLDEMTNGFVEVTGEGITLSMANPLSAGGDDADDLFSGEANSSIQMVTDTDLQVFMSLLWQAGAEAIAVNGNRIGVQTSVRSAGGIILVGVHQIQSPYTIEAIGPSDQMAEALNSDNLPDLYESFNDAGMYPHLSRSHAITLEAADSVDVTHARVG